MNVRIDRSMDIRALAVTFGFKYFKRLVKIPEVISAVIDVKDQTVEAIDALKSVFKNDNNLSVTHFKKKPASLAEELWHGEHLYVEKK
jgi:Na+-translocating ferredoxin:NAD+ oxidoreductase RnfC subunit